MRRHSLTCNRWAVAPGTGPSRIFSCESRGSGALSGANCKAKSFFAIDVFFVVQVGETVDTVVRLFSTLAATWGSILATRRTSTTWASSGLDGETADSDVTLFSTPVTLEELVVLLAYVMVSEDFATDASLYCLSFRCRTSV